MSDCSSESALDYVFQWRRNTLSGTAYPGPRSTSAETFAELSSAQRIESHPELRIPWPLPAEAAIDIDRLISAAQSARDSWIEQQSHAENRVWRCTQQLEGYQHEVAQAALGLRRAEESLAEVEQYVRRKAMSSPAPTSCRRQVEPGFSAALSQTELSIVWPSSTREAIVESTYLIPVMQAARREWLSRKLTEENRAARCALQLSLYKHELERIAAGLAKAEEVLASLEHYAQIRGLRG